MTEEEKDATIAKLSLQIVQLSKVLALNTMLITGIVQSMRIFMIDLQSLTSTFNNDITDQKMKADLEALLKNKSDPAVN